MGRLHTLLPCQALVHRAVFLDGLAHFLQSWPALIPGTGDFLMYALGLPEVLDNSGVRDADALARLLPGVRREVALSSSMSLTTWSASFRDAVGSSTKVCSTRRHRSV